jgi:hypothetical protein
MQKHNYYKVAPEVTAFIKTLAYKDDLNKPDNYKMQLIEVQRKKSEKIDIQYLVSLIKAILP